MINTNAKKSNTKKVVGLHKIQKKTAIESYIMILPQIIGFLVFTIYPLLWAMKFSFYYYDGRKSTMMFTGLENFIHIFHDAKYIQSLGNAFLLMIIKLPIEFTLAITLALILNKKIKGSNAFRNVYFLPNIISTAIIGLIFTNIFSGYNGFANMFLQSIHVIDAPVSWFSSKLTAMIVIVMASTWQSFGINILYVLAALQNIPQDVYESAAIDGANPIQTFFKITLPLLAPVLSIILMLAINGTLQTNDLILVLTNGAPSGSTDVVMTYVLKNVVRISGSSTKVNIGYGSAMAIVTAIVLSLVSLTYMKISQKSREIY